MSVQSQINRINNEVSTQSGIIDNIIEALEGEYSPGTIVDVSDTTALPSDVRVTKYYRKSDGTYTQGTLPNGSATTPSTTITPTISASQLADQITIGVSGTKSITPAVYAGYIASGLPGTVTVSGTSTYTIPHGSVTNMTGPVDDNVTMEITRSENVVTANASMSLTNTATISAGFINSTMQTSGTLTFNKQTALTIPTSSVTVGNLTITPTVTINGNGIVSVSASAVTTATVANDGYITTSDVVNGSATVSGSLDVGKCSITVSSSSVGTSAGSATPSTTDQYVNVGKGYMGWNAYVKINALSAATISAASATSTGTVATTVTPSSSTQYVNISSGLVSTNKYVQVDAAPTQIIELTKTGSTTTKKFYTNTSSYANLYYITITPAEMTQQPRAIIVAHPTEPLFDGKWSDINSVDYAWYHHWNAVYRAYKTFTSVGTIELRNAYANNATIYLPVGNSSGVSGIKVILIK